MDAISEKYISLYSCFEDISTGNFQIGELGLDPKLSKSLEDLIKSRIKPPEVTINGVLKLESYAPEGIEIIRDALNKAEKENISITYRGAGSFWVTVKAEDYKAAEKDLKEATDTIQAYMEGKKGFAEFIREET